MSTNSTAYQREWRRKNPDKRRAYQRAYYYRHRDKYRIADRKRKGIKNPSAETKTGTCPVCLSFEALHYDHNHVTGEFRGWLCGPCNRRLGTVEKWYIPLKDRIDTYLNRD